MRAFVALDLPVAATEALVALQEELPTGRPVEVENLHLTLAFLDDQPVAMLEELHLQLESLRAAPFTLQLRGLDTFGTRDPSVLFASVAAAPALTELHRKVRGAAHAAGIVLARQRFRLHVTLARFRQRLEPAALERLRRFLATYGGFASQPFKVEAFSLFGSTLHKDGAIHEELARYPLH